MKIDLQQLKQDKKLPVILAGVVVVGVLALVLMLRGGGGGGGQAPGQMAMSAPDSMSDPAGMPVGVPGEPGGPEPDMGMGMPPPGPGGATPDMGMMPPGMDPGMAGMGGMPGGAPMGGGRPSSTFPKGAPVEPFRLDPFVPQETTRPVPRLPVMPPIVLAIQPPDPMPVPATVNVIPAGVLVPPDIGELQRRVAGVLWNGKVVAILQTPGDPQQPIDIVRPGDRIPGKDLFVKSISRDQMVLIDEKSPTKREIVIDLKPLPAGSLQPGMGMAPGGAPPEMMPPGMAPGMDPGMAGVAPGG